MFWKCGFVSGKMRQHVKQTESKEADALVFAPLQLNQGPGVAVKASGCRSFACFSFPRASLHYITDMCIVLLLLPSESLTASLGRWGTKKRSHGTATATCTAFFFNLWLSFVRRGRGMKFPQWSGGGGFVLCEWQKLKSVFRCFVEESELFFSWTHVSCCAIWKLPFHGSEIIVIYWQARLSVLTGDEGVGRLDPTASHSAKTKRVWPCKAAGLMRIRVWTQIRLEKPKQTGAISPVLWGERAATKTGNGGGCSLVSRRVC